MWTANLEEHISNIYIYISERRPIRFAHFVFLMIVAHGLPSSPSSPSPSLHDRVIGLRGGEARKTSAYLLEDIVGSFKIRQTREEKGTSQAER